MTQTFSSVEIEQHLQQEEADRTTFTAGTFGQGVADLPPMPTMPARYHFLSEIERKTEGINAELKAAGEQILRDELYRFLEYLWEQMAAESEEGSAA